MWDLNEKWIFIRSDAFLVSSIVCSWSICCSHQIGKTYPKPQELCKMMSRRFSAWSNSRTRISQKSRCWPLDPVCSCKTGTSPSAIATELTHSPASSYCLNFASHRRSCSKGWKCSPCSWPLWSVPLGSCLAAFSTCTLRRSDRLWCRHCSVRRPFSGCCSRWGSLPLGRFLWV